MSETNLINGMPVVITNAITKQVRCRVHKKKRIDKKWLKRYGYKEIVDNSKVLIFNNTILMSQKCYERIKSKVQ